MASQLGQMALDVAEGDALAGLVGEVEDVAGNQLDGLDHAHGVDCRATGTCTGCPLSSRQMRRCGM